MYGYYNGLKALEEGKIVKHLDDNKLNNTEGNLIAVNKKGWVHELATARIGLKTDWVCYLPTVTKDNVVTPKAETKAKADIPQYTEKELQARAIMQVLNEGKTVKEVAEEFCVKAQRVYDVRNGKAQKKATEDLRQAN